MKEDTHGVRCIAEDGDVVATVASAQGSVVKRPESDPLPRGHGDLATTLLEKLALNYENTQEVPNIRHPTSRILCCHGCGLASAQFPRRMALHATLSVSKASPCADECIRQLRVGL